MENGDRDPLSNPFQSGTPSSAFDLVFFEELEVLPNRHLHTIADFSVLLLGDAGESQMATCR